MSLISCSGNPDVPVDPISEDTASQDTTPEDTGPDTESLSNRLLNGGFESGETWWRPSGYANHAWATTGDAIHNSDTTFTAHAGDHAQKIWGLYAGAVPNDAEHGLTLTDLTPGDVHVLTAQAFTHPDDAVDGGSEAVLFLRYLDASGALIEEVTSEPVDADFERGAWQELRIETTAPEGAVSGALGLRFALADWSAGGAVYLDAVSWTSTGTGQVEGERLLVWNDEFTGSDLDESVWTRLELSAYAFNNEQQAYTDSTDNAAVSDGQLVITARQESDGAITSARLVTDGAAEWTYGRIEGMLLVPDGVGTWPAFWMLPSESVYGGWPASGEIDIMEHVGCQQDVIFATVHTGAYNHTLGTQLGGETTRDASGSFHLYAVDWGPEAQVFSVDGEVIFTFENDGAGDSDTWPFDQTFHILLNLAFGGDWGGWCGVDTASLPQEYRIDWVRVYQ
ncbi:MAG: beta-glucanase (GH16 family) [Myxococcota bacterium]|jgi:beta-glucanase (GH16 family)